MKGFLKSKLVLSLLALVLMAGVIAIPLSGSITRSHAAAAAPTTDPIVGDWNVTYGAPAVVTMTLSGGVYTVTAKTPVQVTGSSCYLPIGTIVATFSSTGGNTYSGQHGLWYTSDCSFGYWDPMSLTLSSDGKTLTGVLAGGYGTVTFTKVSSQGLLYAFGDSIAAGYGLGAAEHYPDNLSAYPFQVGQQLHLSVADYASAGACTENSAVESQCNTPTAISVQDQISQAASTGQQPTVVTLTVGANDLDFSYCIPSYFMSAAGVKGFTPCSPSQLNTWLGQFKSGLNSNLAAIKADFPNAKVMLTDYYNPFPGPVQNYSQTCPLYSAIPAVNIYNSLGGVNGSAALFFALASGQYYPFVVTVQRLVYNTIGGIVGRINNGINADAKTYGAIVVPLNFSGHDSCAAASHEGTQWLFGLNMTFQASLGSKSISFSSVGPVCPNIDPAVEPDHSLANQPFSYPGGSALFTADSNCFPHPTAQGQIEIANAVASAAHS